MYAELGISITYHPEERRTRLALQVAAEVLDDFVDGVWLVELASLADPELVMSAVASALGVSEESGRPLLETLVNALSDRHPDADAGSLVQHRMRARPGNGLFVGRRTRIQIDTSRPGEHTVFNARTLPLLKNPYGSPPRDSHW